MPGVQLPEYIKLVEARTMPSTVETYTDTVTHSLPFQFSDDRHADVLHFGDEHTIFESEEKYLLNTQTSFPK